MSSAEATARLAVTLAAAIGSVAGVPQPAMAVLGLASLANVWDLIARRAPGDEMVGRYLLACVMLVALLLGLGLVLNWVPGGLSRENWGIGWGVIATCATVGALLMRKHAPAHRRPGIVALASLGLVAAGATAGFVIGVAGVHREQATPTLELAAAGHTDLNAALVLRSVNDGGRFTVSILPDGMAARSVRTELNLPKAGQHVSHLTLNLPKARTYWQIILRGTGQRDTTQREVILAR